MAQLDEYPLGLLRCPDARLDPSGHHVWCGNDHMILGYMQSHMFAAEIQYLVPYTTSAEVFRELRDIPDHFDTAMTTFHDLVYWIENIGPVDV